MNRRHSELLKELAETGGIDKLIEAARNVFADEWINSENATQREEIYAKVMGLREVRKQIVIAVTRLNNVLYEERKQQQQED